MYYPPGECAALWMGVLRSQGRPAGRYTEISLRLVGKSGRRMTHPAVVVDVDTCRGPRVCAMPLSLFASLGLSRPALYELDSEDGYHLHQFMETAEGERLDIVGWAHCEYENADQGGNAMRRENVYVARNLRAMQVSREVLRVLAIPEDPAVEREKPADIWEAPAVAWEEPADEWREPASAPRRDWEAWVEEERHRMDDGWGAEWEMSFDAPMDAEDHFRCIPLPAGAGGCARGVPHLLRDPAAASTRRAYRRGSPCPSLPLTDQRCGDSDDVREAP